MSEEKPKPSFKEGAMGCGCLIIIVLVLSIFVFFSCGGPAKDGSSKLAKPSVKYIAGKYEHLVGERLSCDIVVKEPADIEQLKLIGHEIAEDAKVREKFRGLIISFFDYPEYFGNGLTLGQITFSPGGKIATDFSVQPGDYSKMTYRYELMNKDWSKRLTQQEVTLWKEWTNYLHSKRTARDERNENIIKAEFAVLKGISVQSVSEVSSKQLKWMTMSKK